jgi:hypothetical protein
MMMHGVTHQKGAVFMRSVVWVSVVLLVIGGLWAGVQPVAVTNADESYPYPAPWDTPVPEDASPTATLPATATPSAPTLTPAPGSVGSNPQGTAPANDENPTTEPTPSPTATLPASAGGQQVFACTSESTVVVSGDTTADTLLVLYFSGRAVSAALSNQMGWYAFHLNMGHEPAGIHPLHVVRRDTGKLIATHYCKIP